MLPPEISRFRKRLLRWFERHGRDLPWRRTHDPYLILVSEVMLQQTQVASVIPYYNAWQQRFPNVRSLADASEAQVLRLWQGLGYYSRARNLLAAAREVVRQYRGVFPRDIGALRRLPGIGRYTADAMAAFAFDQSVLAVDTNVARVIARVFHVVMPIDSSPGRNAIWDLAARLVPRTGARQWNSALMDLGATVCTARNPKCEICPVHAFCRAPQPDSLPLKRPRPRTIRLTELHAFVVRPNEILLQRCQDRWRGMWMLPPCDRIPPNRCRPVHISDFPFTHHRVTLKVYRSGPKQVRTGENCWTSLRELPQLPIPSPHLRAIRAILN